VIDWIQGHWDKHFFFAWDLSHSFCFQGEEGVQGFLDWGGQGWKDWIGKVDGTEADKSEWIKLEFLMDPDYPALGSKYSRQFAIFKDGWPEDWIKWVMAFREIENLIPIKEPADKTRMFRTLFKGQALSYFEHHLMRRLEAEDSDVPDNEPIELVLRDVGLEYIPNCSIRVHQYYMRQSGSLYLGLNTSVQQFVERLKDLNRYLLYFPEENPKQLHQDEIIEILDQAKAMDPEWHEVMVNEKIDIFEMSYEESVSYFKRLENLEKINHWVGSESHFQQWGTSVQSASWYWC
jgi:hypothetical protein